MTEENYEEVKKLLRSTMRPMDGELQRDLWPQMLRRMDQSSLAISLFDWILMAAAIVFLALVPSAIPLLLYQL
jgi:hypothetical protein